MTQTKTRKTCLFNLLFYDNEKNYLVNRILTSENKLNFKNKKYRICNMILINKRKNYHKAL